MNKIGIYIRLSREDETKDKESQSIQTQRDKLKKYLNDNSLTLTKEYIDDGISGTTFDRPAFNQMIQDIKNKKINCIITKDLSRFGRDAGKSSYYLDKLFLEYNVRYIAIDDNYDSLITHDDEMIAFKQFYNSIYPLDISKKVRSALKTKKETGKFTGWKAPYGYIKDPTNKHHLQIDPISSKIVKQIFNLAYHHKSNREIATILNNQNIPTPSMYSNLPKASNNWCDRTIGEILNNQTYIGNLTQGRRKKISYKHKKEIRTPKEEWIIVKNTHEPIIEKDLFEAVNNITKVTKNTKENPRLLSGLMYCKECNHKIGLNKSHDKKRTYTVCNNYRSHSKQKKCTPHTLNYDILENLVLENIKEHYKKNLNINNIINALKKQDKITNEKNKKQNLIEKQNQLDNLITKAYIDYLNGNITKERYEKTTQTINQTIKSINNQIKDLEIQKPEKNYKQIINTFLYQKDSYRTIIINLIDKITISKDKEIKIYYKFKNN